MNVRAYRYLILFLTCSLVLSGWFWTRRAQAATFVVNSTTDGSDTNPGNGVCATSVGVCSLRAAIEEANALAGTDTITFNLGSGSPTITPNSGLPFITTPVIINGATGGATRIQIAGTNAGSAYGLVVGTGSDGSQVSSLVIRNFSIDGLVVASNVTVRNCYIGTDAAGNAKAANGNDGVRIDGSNNTFGGTSAGAGNVISGNARFGIHIILSTASNNQIQGNYIGTNVDGTAGLGNGNTGVVVHGPNNTIGGTSAGARNVISGNGSQGISIDSNGNLVQGNFIGTNSAGSAALGNSANGVLINSGTNNTIGGTSVGARNIISGNSYSGVFIVSGNNLVQGNFIGTDVNGTADLGNSLDGVFDFGVNQTIGGYDPGARNLISGNNGSGVRIQGTGSGVQGNYIGTDVSGTAALGNNQYGVLIEGRASNNAIGGTAVGAGGNVISGNKLDGVCITGDPSRPPNGNLVLGNFIGTNVNSTAAVANGGNGVLIKSASNNTISASVISGNNNNGVLITGSGATGNKIQTSYLGTDYSATVKIGNTLAGVAILSPDNIIGGPANASNVISGNSGQGIYIASSGNKVQGNLIGTDVSGTAALGNTLQGIYVDNVPNNTIGGTDADDGAVDGNVTARNIISGNSDGVYISGAAATSNQVLGNFIGTNVYGTAALGNSLNGIYLQGAPNNTIGGVAAGARNVISGNKGNGVSIEIADGNIVMNNYIGTDKTGTSSLGNVSNGVLIHRGSNNLVGAGLSSYGNTISFNGADGVNISTSAGAPNVTTNNTVQFNTIASNARNGICVSTQTTIYPSGNGFFANSIFSNTLLGIDLGNDGVTANDSGDADTGPNNLQNYPVITSAVQDTSTNTTTIQGTLNSTPNTNFSIQFFSSPTADPSGYGEGQTFRAVTNVTTDGNGNAAFTVNNANFIAPPPPPGHFITATAIDPSYNTSEFSQALPLSQTPIPNVVQFSASNYNVQEDCTTVTVTVNRIGDSSAAASVDYATSDGSATERKDYITALGNLRFAAGETTRSFAVLINEDSYVEGNETFNITLSNPTGMTIGGPAIATVTITDDPAEPSTNAIDDQRNYVCQHYHDFLNRQPDTSGWDFWTNEITSCGTDQACIEIKRINVSAAFYLSIEFQQTGFLVERMYKTAYGDATGTSTIGGAHQLPVPIVRYREFLVDTQQISQGVIVGQSGWETVLENNKQAFAANFVQRSRFTTALPTSMTPDQFVDKLNQNAGNVLSASERTNVISLFGGSGNTTNMTARAQAVRQVAEDADLVNAEFNKGFVLMQYVGYLRRNPDDPQDTDYSGYDFWLTKLNQFNGNYINAEMVKAFITSIEYKQRFGN